MEIGKNIDNIIKVRDDRQPIHFHMVDSEATEKKFELSDGQSVNWVADNCFTEAELRNRIEPWLTSLFQSEHLSLLVGSGLTSAVQSAAFIKADRC